MFERTDHTDETALFKIGSPLKSLSLKSDLDPGRKQRQPVEHVDNSNIRLSSENVSGKEEFSTTESINDVTDNTNENIYDVLRLKIHCTEDDFPLRECELAKGKDGYLREKQQLVEHIAMLEQALKESQAKSNSACVEDDVENISKLKEQNTMLKTSLKDCQEKKAILETSLKDCQEKNSILETSLKDCAEKNAVLETSLKDCQEKNAMLGTSLKDCQEKKALQEKSLKDCQEWIAMLETSLKDCQEKKAELETSFKGYQDKRALLERSHKDLGIEYLRESNIQEGKFDSVNPNVRKYSEAVVKRKSSKCDKRDKDLNRKQHSGKQTGSSKDPKKRKSCDSIDAGNKNGDSKGRTAKVFYTREECEKLPKKKQDRFQISSVEIPKVCSRCFQFETSDDKVCFYHPLKPMIHASWKQLKELKIYTDDDNYISHRYYMCCEQLVMKRPKGCKIANCHKVCE